MTNITRVIKDLIEANTYAEITANTVGNIERVTIDSIVYADQTWANTSNTSVTSAGGYIKLYGKSFEPNANILFGSTTSTSNVVSNNEIQVNVPALATGTYTLFLYNPSGSNAIKYKSIPVQGDYNYGYFTGGISTSTVISSVERIDFSNDSVNTDIRGSLPVQMTFASSSRTKDKTYIQSGTSTGDITGTGVTSIYRITHANDETTALARASVSGPSEKFRASTSSKNYSYTSGGFLSGAMVTGSDGSPGVSTTHRLDFSNDSATVTTKGPLSISRVMHSSASNHNYGWYIGGSPKGYGYFPTISPAPAATPMSASMYSIVDRLNFSSDTITAVVRGPIAIGKSLISTSSNIDYSWISGGITSYSFTGGPSPNASFVTNTQMHRMTFSADNLQMVTRSSFPISAAATAGSGDENYGWFTGGGTFGPSIPGLPTGNLALDASTISTLSSIYRLTYATDTTAASSRSTFYQGRRFHTGNSGVVS